MFRRYIELMLEIERLEQKCNHFGLSNESKHKVCIPSLQLIAKIEEHIKRDYIKHLGFDPTSSIRHTENWPEFIIEIDSASFTAVDFYLSIKCKSKLERDEYIEYVMNRLKKEKISARVSGDNTLFCTLIIKKPNCIKRWIDKKIKKAMDKGIYDIVSEITLQKEIYERDIKKKADEAYKKSWRTI